MSRHSPSRQSSFSFAESSSRRSSVTSNPNIFSDDYALEPVDSRLDLTLQYSTQSDHIPIQHEQTRNTLNITPYPAIPSRLSTLNRPNSISKRQLGNEANPASNDDCISRTLSTSSHFSFVRAQSPYSGPTQPSHPYAMYPQITRASSITSESTIRPQENPFMPTRGPEHPYALYQNTVPDDDDEDIGTQPIPLGFPRLGFGNSGSVGRPGSDVGDIIGSDGHVEQLPPYTRYADNVVAKGDMANINDRASLSPSRRASRRSTIVVAAAAAAAATTPTTPTIARSPTEPMDFREHSEREILLDEETKKESFKDKARRKVCGGIALWVLVLLVAAVAFAGVVGGVIGGVVGRRQGTELGLAAGATTTVWYDTAPAATDKNTPPCPTGRYSIPFNQTWEINSCVMNSAYSKSWACLDFAYLGITISEARINNTKTLQVSFDDYSVDASTYRYGPQPPDFNGSAFDLTPAKDRDDENLGVAMFFYKEFDKLTILPEWIIDPQKRSIEERYVQERGSQMSGHLLAAGDSPWFCFWNSTINEFWIYLEEPATPTSSAFLFASVTPTPAPDPYGSGTAEEADPSTTTFTSTSMKWNAVSIGATPTLQARDAYVSPYLPQYPQLVKMIEKRRPENNVAPYCQRVDVLNDFQIIPRDEVVWIQESSYATTPLQVGLGNARLARRDDDGSVTGDLQSNCVCEWVSV